MEDIRFYFFGAAFYTAEWVWLIGFFFFEENAWEFFAKLENVFKKIVHT